MKEMSMIDAFRALNEIDDEVNEIPVKKRRKKVTEAFSVSLNATQEQIDQAKQELIRAEEEPILKVIDADADTVDHLKKATDYVGQMILQCNVCKTLKYTDPSKLVADPDNDEVVNVKEECPNCHSIGKGFKVIGQVGAVEGQKTEQEEPAEELPALENDAKSEENAEPAFDNDVEEEQPKEEEKSEDVVQQSEEAEEEEEEKPKKKVDKNTQAFDDTPDADDTEDLELPKLGDEFDQDDVTEDDTEKKNESLEEVEASSWKVCKVCGDQKEVIQDNIKDQEAAENLITALKQCNPDCDFVACRGDEKIEDSTSIETKPITEEEEKEEVVPTVQKVLSLIKNESDVKKFKVYTNEEEPKLIFNGPASEMTPSIKDAEVELFNVPAMIVNVVEGKVEGKKSLKDILDCYTNEDEKYISIDNDVDESEIFVGSKAEILENGLGEKYSVVSIEVPTFMEFGVKAKDNQPDALPDPDKEQVEPEEDIVECNMSESYASLDEFKLNNQLKEYSYNYVDSNNENQTYNVLAENLEEAAEKIQTRFNGGTNTYNEILFGNNALKQYINVDVKDIKESVKSESKRSLNESLKDAEDHNTNEDLDNYNEDDSLNMIDEHDEYIKQVVSEWCPEICKETKEVEEVLNSLEALCLDNDEYFNRDKFRPFVIEFIEVNENLDINGEITEEAKDNIEEENNEEIPTDNVSKSELVDIVSDVADEIKHGIEADKDEEKTIDKIVDAKIDELFPGDDEQEVEIECDEAEEKAEEESEPESKPVEEALDDKGMVHVPSIEELAQKLSEDVKVEDDGEVIEIVNDDPEIVPEDKGIEVVDEAIKELPENLIIKLSDLNTEDLEGVKNYLEDKYNTVVENADDLYIEESNDGKSILVDGIIWGKKLEEAIKTIKIIDDEPIVVETPDKEEKPETPTEQIVEDNEIVCKAEKVMTAYQNANKWLDSVKEAVYQGMNCPFFASYIHGLAHTMPGRFDKFGDILHTVNIEIPYPTTEELEKKPENITQAFEIIFKCLDDIKETLNDFIKCTDEKKHGMACAAETLLNDIESEYPALYRLKGMWENAKDDVLGFDKFVMQYLDHKDKLLESIRKERDGKLSEEESVKHCKNRKELTEAINECKNNSKPYKISRSVTEGFRYDVILVKPEEVEKEEEIKSSSELPVNEPAQECSICKCNPCTCQNEVKPEEVTCPEENEEEIEIEHVTKEELKELVKEILCHLNTEICQNECVNEEKEDLADCVSVVKEDVGNEEFHDNAGSEVVIADKVKSQYSEKEQAIINRIMEVGKNTSDAIKDIYGIETDPRLIVADIVQDLRLIKGDIKPENLPDNAVGNATKEMFKNYEACTQFVNQLLKKCGYAALDRTPKGNIERAFRKLNGAMFTKENIYQAIDSEQFRLAAQNGQVPMIAANDPKLLETVMNEQVDKETDIEIPESVEEVKEPEFDNEKFDEQINKYFNENYDNAIVYKTNKGSVDQNGKIILEGTLKGLKEEKVIERSIKFLLEPVNNINESVETNLQKYKVTNNVSDEQFEFSK